MLVLSRKVGESLVIDDHISVTVLSILVLRSELQKAVSTNQDAADAAPPALVNELKSALLHRGNGSASS